MMLAPANSSGKLSSSTQVVTRSCRLMGFQVTAGSATTTFRPYDAASSGAAADTNMLDEHIAAGNSNSVNQWFGPQGVVCNNGLYCTISGTGATFIVYYSDL